MTFSNAQNRFQLLVDAREFLQNRMTGIGRVLAGMLEAVLQDIPEATVVLAVRSLEAVPNHLSKNRNVRIVSLPNIWLAAELRLTILSGANIDLFISPYPKLPLLGCRCPAIHIVHDVLDLTHPQYRKRLKRQLDLVRVKMALRMSNITWYDSNYSLQETIALAGWGGRNPKVRHLGIEDRFCSEKSKYDQFILGKYHLNNGYILCVGNGLPHKNIGILLKISKQLKRQLTFAGVSEANRRYWKEFDNDKRTNWISHVDEEDLPAIYRGAFCLAQPSIAEGYGYPPLEAMACGTPSVISDLPVLRETTGGNAMTANHASPREWLSAFRSLEDSLIYKNFRQKGSQWIAPLIGRKGWAKHTADVRELLHENLA